MADKLVLTVVVLLAASVIELGTTAEYCDKNAGAHPCTSGRNAWALAVGIISAILCLFKLLFVVVKMEVKNVDKVLSLILVLLWIFGTAFNTSTKGPYSVSGNGFFSTWIALLASAYYFMQAWNDMVGGAVAQGQQALGKWLVIVLVTSLIEMSVAADNCDTVGDCKRRNGYAVAVGVVSSALCIIFLLLGKVKGGATSGTAEKVLAFILLVLWCAAAGVTTGPDGPFYATGNGYFTTWFAFFASVVYAYHVFFGDAEGSTNTVSPVQDGV